MAATDAPAAPTRGTGFVAFLTQKRGPFPTWVYAVGLIALVFVYVWWKRKQATSSTSSTTTTPPADTFTPGTGSVWVHRPGSGNTVPPAQPVPQAPPSGPPQTVPPAPPAGGAPPPTNPPGPNPDTAGGTVTVTKWPQADSSVSDIAKRWSPGGESAWPSIWADPHNAGVRQKRGKPELIRKGDQIWVPGKLATPH